MSTAPAQSAPELVGHLFRREAGKMTAYLTKIFGVQRLSMAEDVVQDTLCQALETWSMQGLPANPSAWLMRVARNRAVDLIRRDDQLRYLAPELSHLLRLTGEGQEQGTIEEHEIQDDQLRMMLSCCHEALSTDSQVTLILKTLCGFSVAEIASALLVSEDSIEKRLGRARNVFRQSGSFVEISDASALPVRLSALHQTLYLLFNEGYHGSHSSTTVRDELCYEAIRLALLLADHPQAAQPKTFALLALFCFHAARLSGRVAADGSLLSLEEQDRSSWDRALVQQGFSFLQRSAAQDELSELHLEAAIAALHCSAPHYEQTDWQRISALYDLLYALKPSAVVGLNRAIALGKAHGPNRGLRELGLLPDAGALESYPFFFAAEAELHLALGDRERARQLFETARKVARNPSEEAFFARRMARTRDPLFG